jgi:hypothetical protein
MTKVLIASVAAAAILLSGCMSTFGTSNGQLAYGEIDGRAEGPIEISKSFVYVLHPDLITFGGKDWENLEKVIEPELSRVGGNAVNDLELGMGYTFVDLLLTSLLGGIIGFGHYEVHGQAVSQ